MFCSHFWIFFLILTMEGMREEYESKLSNYQNHLDIIDGRIF